MFSMRHIVKLGKLVFYVAQQHRIKLYWAARKPSDIGKCYMQLTPRDVRVARIRLRMTQEKFGQVLGIGWQTINAYENGRRKIPLYMQHALNWLLYYFLQFNLLIKLDGGFEEITAQHASVMGYKRGPWAAFCRVQIWYELEEHRIPPKREIAQPEDPFPNADEIMAKILGESA